MKAIVCTKYGPPDVLQLREVEKPTPKDNEVLVRIYAITVSTAICRTRSSSYPPVVWLPARMVFGLLRPKNPMLGYELARTGQLPILRFGTRMLVPKAALEKMLEKGV